MTVILYIGGFVSFALGFMVAITAKTAFHEIVAAICITNSFLMIGIASLLNALEPIRFVAHRLMLKMQDADREAEAARQSEKQK